MIFATLRIGFNYHYSLSGFCSLLIVSYLNHVHIANWFFMPRLPQNFISQSEFKKLTFLDREYFMGYSFSSLFVIYFWIHQPSRMLSSIQDYRNMSVVYDRVLGSVDQVRLLKTLLSCKTFSCIVHHCKAWLSSLEWDYKLWLLITWKIVSFYEDVATVWCSLVERDYSLLSSSAWNLINVFIH